MKNPHAVELGRLGGLARAKKLSRKRRLEIARNASLARFCVKLKQLDAKKVLDSAEEEIVS